MITRIVIEYLDEHGNSPFARWFADTNTAAAVKVTTALYRLEQGNFSNTKSVGKGVFEYKIDFGPGYRIYFGEDGNDLILLLTGGTKKSQSRDIKQAHMYWADFKRRKK